MSVSTVATIKNRIISATESSKIAVFRSYRGEKIDLDAVFDETINTRKRIKFGDRHYVGSYFGVEGRLEFSRDLREQ